MHYDFIKRQFVESNGLDFLSEFNTTESRLLLLLSTQKRSFEELLEKLPDDKSKLEKAMNSLRERNLVDVWQDKETELFSGKKQLTGRRQMG